ncbi:hypothetical protein PM082_014314 [Marasmius tenuissimus]|nr:hypothetical protein PM082_014314 [Marasmius tenuissimus]
MGLRPLRCQHDQSQTVCQYSTISHHYDSSVLGFWARPTGIDCSNKGDGGPENATLHLHLGALSRVG